MDTTYTYTKQRLLFGRQVFFKDDAPKMLDDVKADKALMNDYIYKNPVNKYTQCLTVMAEHEINTHRATLVDRGMVHTEGGWPKDVNPQDIEQVIRFRKKVEKDENYIAVMRVLLNRTEHYVLQNNAVDIYEKYFEEGESVMLREDTSCRLTNAFKDQCEIKRPVSHISWSVDGGEKMAVSHCNMDFGYCHPDVSCDSYIWDVETPIEPELVLKPHVPIVNIEYSNRDFWCLVSGLFSGQVALWDPRKGPTPAILSLTELSHRDPVHDVLWIASKMGNEFFTTSTDGQVMWWDTRNMYGPYEKLVMDLAKGDSQIVSHAPGSSSLEFEASIPTRFMVGTVNGLVIQGNRKGKLPSEKISGYTKAHNGPVVSLQRNAGFAKCYLSIGDFSTKIWSEECKESPIMWTGLTKAIPTCGAWSTARYSVLCVTKDDGCLDLWDILQEQEHPTLAVKISDSPLTTLRIQEEGVRIAVGDNNGKVQMVELTENLAINQKNDKAALAAMFDRESRRERILEARNREIKLKLKAKHDAEAGAVTEPQASEAEMEEPRDPIKDAEDDFQDQIETEKARYEKLIQEKLYMQKAPEEEEEEEEDNEGGGAGAEETA